ncbi:restriction endonuclease subunit S [Mesorhizobium caraganae]|uniref:Restriction endonuclease subunit S n=1 Tax=Mesorhizobium caraganae TaxID=483206 RepID=A0ABV1YVH8_9HYPH
MSGEVPEGWTIGPMVQFFELQRGHDLPAQSREAGGVPVIASNGIVGWHNQSPLSGPGVVTGRSGTIGKVNYIKERYWPLNTTLYVRDFKGSEPEFVYRFLEHFPLTEFQSGTGVPTLNRNDIHPIDVVFPPLDEQRRIAEVLRSVDNAIAAAQQVAEHSRALQSLLTTVQCFGHGYEMINLGDILADIRYGTSVKCDANEADGYPVLRIPNVVNGRVELDDLKYAAVSDADLRRFGLEAGDIVVVRTNGNRAYIGRSALVADGAATCLFASYLIRMRFDTRRAWSPYVYAILNSQPVREKLLKAATTSAGNYNINTTSLKGIAVPLPNLETQHQIGEVIQLATEAANACEDDVKHQQRVKANIMSDLLSGRVRVPA